jgi:hypothetical protein
MTLQWAPEKQKSSSRRAKHKAPARVYDAIDDAARIRPSLEKKSDRQAGAGENVTLRQSKQKRFQVAARPELLHVRGPSDYMKSPVRHLTLSKSSLRSCLLSYQPASCAEIADRARGTP